MSHDQHHYTAKVQTDAQLDATQKRWARIRTKLWRLFVCFVILPCGVIVFFLGYCYGLVSH